MKENCNIFIARSFCSVQRTDFIYSNTANNNVLLAAGLIGFMSAAEKEYSSNIPGRFNDTGSACADPTPGFGFPSIQADGYHINYSHISPAACTNIFFGYRKYDLYKYIKINFFKGN